MMGPRQIEQGVLFYNFSLDAHVPADHLLRSIDRFVELSELRRELSPTCSDDCSCKNSAPPTRPANCSSSANMPISPSQRPSPLIWRLCARSSGIST